MPKPNKPKPCVVDWGYLRYCKEKNMDLQKCNICGKKFDFDKEGLGCGKILVCSDKCAMKSAKSRSHRYAIHNERGNIIKTNATGEEKLHYY